MGEFAKGDGMNLLMLDEKVAREAVMHSSATTRSSMLSDDEVLTLAHSSSVGILRFGNAWGLGAQACVISSELENAARSGQSRSLSAYDVCRKALELYSQENGVGQFFCIVNSRLRRVKSIQNPTRDCYVRAVTESCGDLADFVRLVWEGLNFEFRGTARGGTMIFRGVELQDAALESYRKSFGKRFSWATFASFTEKRAEAEEYGIA
jgi:hypothetical protein